MPCFSGKYFQTFWHIFCRYILFGCQESLTNFIVCLTDLSRGMENVRMRCDLSHQNWGGRECLGRVRAAGQSGMRLNLVFNSYFIDRGSLYRRGPGSCDDSLRRICWIAAVDVFQKLKCQLIFKQHFFLLALWCLVVGVGRKMIQTWWQPIASVWIFLLSTYFSTYFRCEIWYSACYVTSHCWVSAGLGSVVSCGCKWLTSHHQYHHGAGLGCRWLFSIQRLFAALCKYLVNTQQESGLAALWRLQCREAARRHNSVVSTSVLELLVTTIRALYTVDSPPAH